MRAEEDRRKSRREFFSDLARPATPTEKISVRTGKRGEKISLLGFGALRPPTKGDKRTDKEPGGKQTPIDQDAFNALVDGCLANGVNYFDTAPPYCCGQSERVLGIALSRHPRDSYYVATKMSNMNPRFWPIKKSKAMFETSLANLHTDHIDFYLLHSIGSGGFKTFKGRFLENGLLDWLVEQRKIGRIRNLGFSYHDDPKAFEWCMENHGKYDWDFALIQMNYVDWRHAKEVSPRNLNAKYLYETLTAKGIPVMVMEPMLGGRLARFNYAVASKLKGMDPDATIPSWAFRFCGSFPNVLTVLSGVTYMEHLKQNVVTFSPLKPLVQKEFDTLEEAAQLLLKNKTIPCNLCQYCMPCPYGIDIPGVFDAWNTACTEDRLPDNPSAPNYAAYRRRFLKEYDAAVPHLRRADHCIGCGRCSPHCPQGIDIPARMVDIDIRTATWRKEERHV